MKNVYRIIFWLRQKKQQQQNQQQQQRVGGNAKKKNKARKHMLAGDIQNAWHPNSLKARVRKFNGTAIKLKKKHNKNDDDDDFSLNSHNYAIRGGESVSSSYAPFVRVFLIRNVVVVVATHSHC